MNVTKEDRTSQHLRHPEWCPGTSHHCTAEISDEGFIVGRHYEAHRHFPTTYGCEIAVGLVAEVRGENDPKISLRLSGTETEPTDPHHERWPFDGQVELEPEEAALLARRLNEAVARWHAAGRDHQESE